MDFKKTLFCNIGWLDYYDTDLDFNDIEGNFAYIQENGTGNEINNFKRCNDNNTVYGFVEAPTIDIHKNLGADKEDNKIDGITVIWTAPRKKTGGNFIVGIYKNATVYKHLEDRPYNITVKKNNAILILPECRTQKIPSGYIGRSGIRYARNPSKCLSKKEVTNFLKQVKIYVDKLGSDRQEHKILNNDNYATKKQALINARVGQGKYRDDLIEEWGGCCAISNCNDKRLLIASHIKPWSESNSSEKLDKNNGLLLIAHLDKAFDQGLISFDDNGVIMISKELLKDNKNILDILGVNTKTSLKKLHKNTAKYLKWHRENTFIDSKK